jgi:hypothetical protein
LTSSTESLSSSLSSPLRVAAGLDGSLCISTTGSFGDLSSSTSRDAVSSFTDDSSSSASNTIFLVEEPVILVVVEMERPNPVALLRNCSRRCWRSSRGVNVGDDEGDSLLVDSFLLSSSSKDIFSLLLPSLAVLCLDLSLVVSLGPRERRVLRVATVMVKVVSASRQESARGKMNGLGECKPSVMRTVRAQRKLTVNDVEILNWLLPMPTLQNLNLTMTQSQSNNSP